MLPGILRQQPWDAGIPFSPHWPFIIWQQACSSLVMGESATAHSTAGVRNDADSRTSAPNLRKCATAVEYTPTTSFALFDADHGIKATQGMLPGIGVLVVLEDCRKPPASWYQFPCFIRHDNVEAPASMRLSSPERPQRRGCSQRRAENECRDHSKNPFGAVVRWQKACQYIHARYGSSSLAVNQPSNLRFLAPADH